MNLPGFCIHFSAFTRGHGILVRLWQALQGYDCKYAPGLTEHLKVKDTLQEHSHKCLTAGGLERQGSCLGRGCRLENKSRFAYYPRKSPGYIPAGRSIHM